MRRAVGVVREAYSKWERRAPLTPDHVARLTRSGVATFVQPCSKRIFDNAEYTAAGAVITDDLSQASAIFGVKQVPVEQLLPNKTYMFFTHTIKAQEENMPLLDECLRRNIRLLDYECVRKDGDSTQPR